MIKKHIQKEEEQTGENFDGAGKHISGYEAFAVLSVVVAQHDVEGEQCDDKEKKDNEGQRGSGILGKQPLEKQGKPCNDDRKDDYAERELPNGYLLTHV